MSRFEQALSIFNYIISTPKALYLLFKIKPDVIHVHYPVTSFIAKLYKFLTKKKFVATYHTIGIPKHLLHQRADVVIAISQDLKSELIDRFNYKNSQIRLIFNGISQTRFDVEIDRTQKLIIKRIRTAC